MPNMVLTSQDLQAIGDLIDLKLDQKLDQKLEEKLEQTKPCAVEIILKDISTVRHQPQRLWDWARIASEVSAKYA